jgi:hypothetical protein
MAIDLSILPTKLQKQAREAFEDGMGAIGALSMAFTSEEEVAASAAVYRPQLRLVRRIEKNVRDLTLELKLIDQELNRLEDNEESQLLKERLKEKRISVANTLVAAQTSFPENWDEVYANFSSLVNAENKARLMYRRQADNSYGSIKDIVNIVDGYDRLFELGQELQSLRERIDIGSPKIVSDDIKLVASKIGRISGANKIKSLLTKSRKALKKKKVNKEKVLDYYNKAILEYEIQLAWMREAKDTILPDFQVYLMSISDTLGARLQETLPRSTALYITSCTSGHRDISLNF